MSEGSPQGLAIGGVFSFLPFLWTSKEKGKTYSLRSMTIDINSQGLNFDAKTFQQSIADVQMLDTIGG
ncbi:hypothetical protein GCM10009123_13770 [Kangiella japonica]|uniref:Uncharacterized protein n=1 Tax=Kangiella japonica TaxID=647384 RepID=A0ABN0SZH3_9GAMM